MSQESLGSQHVDIKSATMIDEILNAIAYDNVDALEIASNDINFDDLLVVQRSRHDCILCHSVLCGAENCTKYFFGRNIVCSHSGKTLIYNAACGGSLSIIQYLTQSGISPFGALRGALRHGHNDIVLFLLINEYESMVSELEDNSLVMDAARGGNVESMKIIIEQKPDILNFVNEAGETPLHVAAKYGHDELLHYLIALDQIEINNSVLEASIRSRDWKAVKELIGKNGVDFIKPNKEGKSPLDIALEVGEPSIILLLMKLLKLPNEFYVKAFFQSIKNDKIEIVDVFLNAGVNINMRNERGQTPLHIAAMNGNEELVHKILSCPSIDTTIRDKKGETALIKAKNAKIRRMIQEYKKKA